MPNFTTDQQLDVLISLANADTFLIDTQQRIVELAAQTNGLVPLQVIKDYNVAAKRFYAATREVWTALLKQFPALTQIMPAEPSPPGAFLIADGTKAQNGLIPFTAVSLVTDGRGLEGLGAAPRVRPTTVAKGSRTFTFREIAVAAGQIGLVGAALTSVFWVTSSMRADALRAEAQADQVNAGVILMQRVLTQCEQVNPDVAACAAVATKAYKDFLAAQPSGPLSLIETLGYGVAAIGLAILGYRTYVRYSEGRWPFNRRGGYSPAYALPARASRDDDDE
jgi:hypothetical protein